MDNKNLTSQSEIYSLMNILKNIHKLQQYENSKPKSKQPKSTGQLSPEKIKQIEREVLGIYP